MNLSKFKIASGCLLVFLSIQLVFTQVPPGYYNAARDKKKDALKTSLYQLAYPIRVLNYGSGSGATWEGFYQTDRNADGSVIDMYSSIVRFFNGYNGVTDMHIEHSFPKSWWGGVNNYAYRDLFHLFPADGTTNSTKNNHPLGEIYGTPSFNNGVSKIGANGFGGVYTGTCFEPANEFKGDFARAYFYIVTIHENLSNAWDSPMLQKNKYPTWTPWALQLLTKWHQQDPVSLKERLRQEAVYKIQGNRNPFIDYPGLVSYIWGKDTVSAYPFEDVAESFISSPNRGTALNYGVILKTSSKSETLTVKGENMTSALTLSMKRNVGFSVSPASMTANQANQGMQVSVTFSPVQTGVFVDTLIISGGGLTSPFLIPLRGQAAGELMVLEPESTTPVGATLNWIADPLATQYKVRIRQGSAVTGNLIISAYVEGSSNNKALELFNGTGQTVNLSNYVLRKQSNGAGSFESAYPLSGQLAANASFLLVHKFATADSPLKLMANALTDSVLNFNGNDAVALYHHGILIDMVGVENGGDALVWGVDKTLIRKNEVSHPTKYFNADDWITDGKDSIRYLGKHLFQASLPENYVSETFVPATQNSLLVTSLNPANDYVVLVESYRSGTVAKSVNSVRFKTANLEAPVVMDASDVKSGSFIANWESDLYISNYLLDVFKTTGSPDVTLNEDFINTGSNGKPLSTGWTGTASGNYTTTTSSGVAPPSIALKNSGEYIQTPELPGAATRLSFMYRYPSGAGASYFKVEAYNGTSWVKVDSIPYVNTSKIIMDYQFNRELRYTSFRIVYTYKASSGNLAIDDISITCNTQSVEYVLKDQPVTGNEFLVTTLDPATTYFYKARSVKGSSVSPYSETIQVTTTLGTDVTTVLSQVKIFQNPEGVYLEGLKDNSRVSVFNLTGSRIYDQQTNLNELFLRLPAKGMFIISIQQPLSTRSFKIIR